MKVLILLGLVLATEQAQASDGPQNTGRLALEMTEGNELQALLQVDRIAVSDLFGPVEQIETEQINRLVRVTAGSEICSPTASGQTASDTVLSVVINFACAEPPREVAVELPNANALPAGFSLGVRAASGHHGLDAMNPSAKIVVSRTLFFFRLGFHYLWDTESLENAGLNRQAALWFGGFHRLPFGIGLLITMLAIWLAPLQRGQRLGMVGMYFTLASVTTTWVLQAQLTQSVHAFLYSSHIYFGLVALIFSFSLIDAAWRPKLAIVGIAAAGFSYGFEQSTVLWTLERIDHKRLFPVVAAFGLGNLAGLVPFAILAWVTSLATRQLGRQKAEHAQKLIAGTGVATCVYLVVFVFLRARI